MGFSERMARADAAHIRRFGDSVTFMSPSQFFMVKGVFSEREDPAAPMDGTRAQQIRTLSCLYDDVKDVTALYTVEVKGREYPVLATPPAVEGLVVMVLGAPK